MNRIETLLRRKIGLDAASVGATAIERTVRLRMKTLGYKDVAAYLAHVNAAASEWEELLEAVVVTETWFFRDTSPFNVFVQLAQQELLPPRTNPLRVLSVPCATGEEPFSLAMALLDAGISGHRFSIEAVDISARALERAQLGLYGKNSFRGKTLAYRSRHFTASANSYRLNQPVRDSVRFARGNLLAAEFLTDRAPYDFVFCRNLLIYFDRATQRLALQQLQRLLTETGILFVGAAELPLVLENGFTPINQPMAFASRKTAPNTRHVDWRTLAGPAVNPTPPPQTTAAPPTGIQSQTSHPPPSPELPLDEARRLADAGHLQEAAALCETHLQTLGPSAAAYYLLGLVRDAAGDATAIEYYRKALYLEPNHHETLHHLALHLERNGDPAGAQTLRRRANRQQPQD